MIAKATRLAVFADTHGNRAEVLRALSENRPFDAVVHLGDGVEDGAVAAADLGIGFYGISGNEDRSCTYPDLHMVVIDTLGIMCVHGHQLDMNPYSEPAALETSYGELAAIAGKAGAKIILFGHTHMPLVRICEGIVLMNPGDMYAGSMTRPTFGILEKKGGTVDLVILRRADTGYWAPDASLRIEVPGVSAGRNGSAVAGGA